MAKLAEIYGLYHPVTDELRYIGKANNAAKRLSSHLRDAKRRKTPVYCWINSLSEKGLVPKIKVLETCIDWKEAERRLIEISRARGDRLLNIADGGDEPFCSIETRKRNGAKNAAEIHSDPFRKKIWFLKKEIMSAHKKNLLTESVKAKIRIAAEKRPDLFGSLLVVCQ